MNISAKYSISVTYVLSAVMIILNSVIMVKNFSSFWQVFQFTLNLLPCMWRIWAKNKSTRTEEVHGTKKLCSERKVDDKLPHEAEMMAEKPEAEKKSASSEALAIKRCSHENRDGKLNIKEVIAVLRKLGTSYDPDGDMLPDWLGSNDIAALFEKQEPSFQEIEQAFAMFDVNSDGFIDAEELRKFLCILCFLEASEADCKRMIRVYDDDGDGLIDPTEFARLLAKSFS